MAEELLHRAKIRAGVEEVRREGVAKRVHRKSRILIDLLQELADDELHGAHADARARAREKERGAIDLAERARELVALRLVVAERELRMIAERNYPLLAPLPRTLSCCDTRSSMSRFTPASSERRSPVE